MGEKRQPWGKWYWGDWRKDARLRRCSYAARGLWADMLSLMGGECDRFGYLVMEGQELLASDLAGLLGGSEREIVKLIAELEGKRVFSRVGDANLEDDLKLILHSDMPVGSIFSRRMVRDKAKEESDRANGRKGGNPTLNPEEVNATTSVNGGVNPPDKAQSQKLESEGRKKETSSLRSDVCAEPLARSSPPLLPESPAFIALETNRKGENYIVSEAQVHEFQELYPAVDIEQELRGMRGWLMANPGKRKTRSGMLRFINGWLSKEQNKGHSNGGNGSKSNGKRGAHQNHLEGLRRLIGEADERSEAVPQREHEGQLALSDAGDGRHRGIAHGSG